MDIESAKQLKHFGYKLLVFLLIVFVLDQACGKILSVIYFKQNHGNAYNTTYALEKVKSDVLIIGSSRAQHHYNPQIFEDTLNMSCYNAGRAGQAMFFYDAVLKSAFKRYTPKVIILDLVPSELQSRQDDYDRLSSLLPYYSRHPEIRDLILLKSPYERLKLLSAIYPYNSLLISSVTGALDLHHKGDAEVKNKGFSHSYHNIAGDTISTVTFNNVLDPNKINILQSFIKKCQERKIKLYILISPYLVKYGNRSESITEIKKLANDYHIKTWDYSQDSYYLSHHELFNDYLHLNVTGANFYSKFIAKKIKDDLRNETAQN